MPDGSRSGAIVGVDVGGTKTHAVCYDADFEPLGQFRLPTSTDGEAAVIELVTEMISTLVARIGEPIVGIGVGIPGRVDRQLGSVRQAVNLGIGGDPIDLADRLTAAHEVPCVVDNDVNAAALGAHRLLDEELGVSDLAYLSIGTGIAAGIILDGQLHRGSNGAAGEIGHFPIAADGPQCECGLNGCLEVLASGAAIGRSWPTDGRRSPAEALIAEARRGDEQAKAVLDPIADHLARAVYLLAVTFDVPIIVIGGGVADVGQPLLDTIRDGLRRMERRSAFVRSLDLADRLLLKPAGAIGPLGAASLLWSEGPR